MPSNDRRMTIVPAGMGAGEWRVKQKAAGVLTRRGF